MIGSSATLLVGVEDDSGSGVTPLPVRWQLVDVTGPSMSPTLRHGDRLLVNPGSVGQSRTRDPRARCAILDDDGTVELLAVEYEVEATRRALRERGLPEDACHLRPRPLLRRVAGRAARTLRL